MNYWAFQLCLSMRRNVEYSRWPSGWLTMNNVPSGKKAQSYLLALIWNVWKSNYTQVFNWSYPRLPDRVWYIFRHNSGYTSPSTSIYVLNIPLKLNICDTAINRNTKHKRLSSERTKSKNYKSGISLSAYHVTARGCIPQMYSLEYLRGEFVYGRFVAEISAIENEFHSCVVFDSDSHE